MIRDTDPAVGGYPRCCAEPASWRGRYRTSQGKVYAVWGCDEHVEGLDEVRAMP
jgi:hypothetical protein